MAVEPAASSHLRTKTSSRLRQPRSPSRSGGKPRLGGLLISIDAIADCLQAEERLAIQQKRGGHWGAFQCGIAAALAGRLGTARTMFDAVLAGPRPPGSVLHPMAQSMSELVGDDAAFRRHVFEVIEGQRLKLKLPPFDRARLM